MHIIELAVAGLLFAVIISAGVGAAVLLTHLAMNALDYGGENDRT